MIAISSFKCQVSGRRKTQVCRIDLYTTHRRTGAHEENPQINIQKHLNNTKQQITTKQTHTTFTKQQQTHHAK